LSSLDITPEEFSAAELGKILTVLLKRYSEGLSPDPSKLASELSGDEMAILTRICEKDEMLADSAAALRDYISVVRMERTAGSLEQLIAFKKEQMDREEKRQ
jgi:hypothetical protein